MAINIDIDIYSLTIYEKIGFGFVRKTIRTAKGFVACYGGGGKLYFGKSVYLRIWRIIVVVKLPFIKLQYFEIFWPKKYILQ